MSFRGLKSGAPRAAIQAALHDFRIDSQRHTADEEVGSTGNRDRVPMWVKVANSLFVTGDELFASDRQFGTD
jgi:hypothetical protein